MDVWNEKQKSKMRLGGNSRFKQVLAEFAMTDELGPNLPTSGEATASRIPGAQKEKFTKYNTKALQWYRDALTAQVDGAAAPNRPGMDEAQLPVHVCAVTSRNSTPNTTTLTTTLTTTPTTMTTTTTGFGGGGVGSGFGGSLGSGVDAAVASGSAALAAASGFMSGAFTSLSAKLQEPDAGWAELLDSALAKTKAVASATQKAATEMLNEAKAGEVVTHVKAKADGVASWVKENVTLPMTSSPTTAVVAPVVSGAAAPVVEDPMWAELR